MVLMIILIVFCIAIVAMGLGIWKTTTDYDARWCGKALVIAGVVCACICILSFYVKTCNIQQEVTVFIRQKEYFETHSVQNTYEDAALTNKKIEINEWLIKAQFDYTHYPLTTFYDESIMDLELIE